MASRAPWRFEVPQSVVALLASVAIAIGGTKSESLWRRIFPEQESHYICSGNALSTAMHRTAVGNSVSQHNET